MTACTHGVSKKNARHPKQSTGFSQRRCVFQKPDLPARRRASCARVRLHGTFVRPTKNTQHATRYSRPFTRARTQRPAPALTVATAYFPGRATRAPVQPSARSSPSARPQARIASRIRGCLQFLIASSGAYQARERHPRPNLHDLGDAHDETSTCTGLHAALHLALKRKLVQRRQAPDDAGFLHGLAPPPPPRSRPSPSRPWENERVFVPVTISTPRRPTRRDAWESNPPRGGSWRPPPREPLALRPVLETSGEVTGDNARGLRGGGGGHAHRTGHPALVVNRFSRIHRDITVVRVRSALDSRRKPSRYGHAFSRDRYEKGGPRSARRRGQRRERPAGTASARDVSRARRCVSAGGSRAKARASHVWRSRGRGERPKCAPQPMTRTTGQVVCLLSLGSQSATSFRRQASWRA